MTSEEFKIRETWEIYSTDEYEKIAKRANAKITARVRMALADMEEASKTQDVGPKLAVKLFKKYINPVFKQYQKLGTYDTEPRANVADTFARYADHLGGDGDAVYETLRWL